MNLRADLTIFARRMEAKLRANDYKPHFSSSTIEEHHNRLYEELHELSEAIEHNHSKEQIMNECADVANFAMFIASLNEPWYE